MPDPAWRSIDETVPPPSPAPVSPRPRREEPRQDPEELVRRRKRRARLSFVFALLFGQALILASNLLGPLILHMLRVGAGIDLQVPIALLVFLGIAGGLAITAAVLSLALVLSIATGHTRGEGAHRTIWRFGKAGAAFAVTALWLGGTALLCLPRSEWWQIPTRTTEMVQEAWKRMGSRRPAPEE